MFTCHEVIAASPLKRRFMMERVDEVRRVIKKQTSDEVRCFWILSRLLLNFPGGSRRVDISFRKCEFMDERCEEG